MKTRYIFPSLVFWLLIISACKVAKKTTQITPTSAAKVLAKDNTLLWRISGNQMQKPSYVLGTMHIQCANEAVLSDSVKAILNRVDKIYFELDMSNPLAMLGAVTKMNMKGDTTLKTLLSEKDYEELKAHFKTKKVMLPFSMIEKMLPMFASTMLMESESDCEGGVSGTEMRVMEYNKANRALDIDGLEGVLDQMNALGIIPYKQQADQLMEYIRNGEKLRAESKKLLDAFKSQNLESIETLIMTSDPAMTKFMDVLLINRNKNWVEKCKEIFRKESIIAAVGAGHLVGKEGVLQLLLNAGYTVEPVHNL